MVLGSGIALNERDRAALFAESRPTIQCVWSVHAKSSDRRNLFVNSARHQQTATWVKSRRRSSKNCTTYYLKQGYLQS